MLTLLKDRVIKRCFVIKDRVIRLIRAIIIKIICVKIHKNTSFLIIFYYLCPKITIKNKEYEHINITCTYFI